MEYSSRTGEEDLSTLWLSSNPFCSCVSVRLDGARGLTPAIDLLFEVRVGQSVRVVPLLLSRADLEAGGGGRIDGGQLSERVDLLTEGHPRGLELRLTVTAHGRLWTQSHTRLFGHLALPAAKWADGTAPSACASEWVPISTGGDGREEITRRMSGEGQRSVLSPGERGGVTASRQSGPALLVRVQCFDRAELMDAAARDRLIGLYSGERESVTRVELDQMLLRLGEGMHVGDGELELGLDGSGGVASPWGRSPWGHKGGARTVDGKPVGCCKACVGRIFAGVGIYKPHDTLLEYLMFYHTLLWVCCRPPGEEHISIIHRFLFL